MTLNWKAILDRKNQIITKHVKGLDFLMRKNKVTTSRLRQPDRPGQGRHPYRRSEAADGKTETMKAKKVVLATGSDARMLPGSSRTTILTNVEILSMDQMPKSLVVIGSGAVGVEFGSIFKSFGSDVTIVEMLPRMVPNEDEDVSKELVRVFRKRGIESMSAPRTTRSRRPRTA